MQEDDIRVSMTEKQLNGSQRVLLDKVISEDQCRELQRLSNVSYNTAIGASLGFFCCPAQLLFYDDVLAMFRQLL